MLERYRMGVRQRLPLYRNQTLTEKIPKINHRFPHSYQSNVRYLSNKSCNCSLTARCYLQNHLFLVEKFTSCALQKSLAVKINCYSLVKNTCWPKSFAPTTVTSFTIAGKYLEPCRASLMELFVKIVNS